MEDRDTLHRVSTVAVTLARRLPDVHPDTIADLAREIESQFTLMELRYKLTGSSQRADDPWANPDEAVKWESTGCIRNGNCDHDAF